MRIWESEYFEISKNLEIFTTLYKEVNTFYVDDGRNDVWGTPFDKRKDYVLNGPQSAYVDARLRTYTGEKLGLNPIQVEGNNLKIVADRVPAESRAKFDNIMDFTDNNKVNTYYRQG